MKQAIFRYPPQMLTLPQYTAHAGQVVTIVRELESGVEYDDEGDRMFRVRADDGWEGDAYQSELEYLPEHNEPPVLEESRAEPAVVVKPGAHQFEVHTDCQKTHCNICDGGLKHCVVCGQAEGTLEDTCPGKRTEHNEPPVWP